MSTNRMSQPIEPSFNIGRRQMLTAGVLSAAGIASRPLPALAETNPEILRAAEAIHQERTFKATRQRVYAALTVESQFEKIIDLSGVMQDSAMSKAQKPTKLSPNAGSEFTLFGGYIIGRQVELVPNELIVQAWRSLSWAAGVYSIARFQLTDRGGSTQLVFDHTGFPQGQAEHLAAGWQQHYWDPLTKLLAGS